MRKWLLVALSAAALGCSGGSDPVRTVGGDGEYEGPGASDPYGGGAVGPSTPTSTLVVLCTKACAHLRAEDCDGAPAHTADACPSMCSSQINSELGSGSECADEMAALFTCVAEANVTCSGMLGDQPIVTACDDEETDLTKCQSPGSDCAVSPEVEITCLEIGLPTFMFCSEGVAPPPGCIQISSSGFCCP
ncbi:MAG: hypothetical protein HUU21_36955 [Polyangiaceae bacterium]|nr:hypothetical protein [Polyangiaceae bacterium]